MADNHPRGNGSEAGANTAEETSTKCGFFDFLKKKGEEKPMEEMAMVEEEKKEKHTLKESLHESDSHSSSSSDEEGEGEGEEKKKKKKKKKKGLKEKMKAKLSGEEEENAEQKEEKCEGVANAEAAYPKEEKGILDKIKEKIPGQGAAAATESAAHGHSPEGEAKEKKGILEKIKEKMPGYHHNEEKKQE